MACLSELLTLSKVNSLSTSCLYFARSSAGLWRYDVGLLFIFASKSSPDANSSDPSWIFSCALLILYIQISDEKSPLDPISSITTGGIGMDFKTSFERASIWSWDSTQIEIRIQADYQGKVDQCWWQMSKWRLDFFALFPGLILGRDFQKAI